MKCEYEIAKPGTECRMCCEDLGDKYALALDRYLDPWYEQRVWVCAGNSCLADYDNWESSQEEDMRDDGLASAEANRMEEARRLKR